MRCRQSLGRKPTPLKKIRRGGGRKNNTEKKIICEPLLDYYYKIQINFNYGHKEFVRKTQNKEYVLGYLTSILSQKASDIRKQEKAWLLMSFESLEKIQIFNIEFQRYVLYIDDVTLCD